MHLIGRYEAVRPLSPDGLGPRYILDRRAARLLPGPEGRGERGPLGSRVHGEWIRSREGLWLPSIAGGVGASGWQQRPTWALGFGSHGTWTTFTTTMSSAYVYVTTGAGMAARFRLRAGLTLNNVYYNISSYTGTAANVNDINIELRNDASKPGSTLHASAVSNPASATGWINSSGWTFALSADTPYWICVVDADGNATDNAVLLRGASFNSASAVDADTYLQSLLMAALTTTNGFSTVSMSNGWWPCIVLAFSDGSVLGIPYATSASVTSDTNQKGLSIDGLTEQLKVFGVKFYNDTTAISSVKLMAGSALPADAALATASVELATGDSATATQVAGYAFTSGQTLAKSTAYRVVCAFSAASTNPTKVSIGTGADATLRKAMLGGGTWKYTTENATPGWTDDGDALPRMALLIEDQVAVAAGGGLMTHPGMAGGMRG